MARCALDRLPMANRVRTSGARIAISDHMSMQCSSSPPPPSGTVLEGARFGTNSSSSHTTVTTFPRGLRGLHDVFLPADKSILRFIMQLMAMRDATWAPSNFVWNGRRTTGMPRPHKHTETVRQMIAGRLPAVVRHQDSSPSRGAAVLTIYVIAGNLWNIACHCRRTRLQQYSAPSGVAAVFVDRRHRRQSLPLPAIAGHCHLQQDSAPSGDAAVVDRRHRRQSVPLPAIDWIVGSKTARQRAEW